MPTPILALVPLLHIALTVALVIAAAVNVRKNPGVAGILALLAAGVAMLTVWLFTTLLSST